MHFTCHLLGQNICAHMLIFMHSFIITLDRLYSKLPCSCTPHAHALIYHMFSLRTDYILCSHAQMSMLQGLGFQVLGFRVQGIGFIFQDLRLLGLGFKVQGFRFKVQGFRVLWFRFWCIGFRVQHLGFQIHTPMHSFVITLYRSYFMIT